MKRVLVVDDHPVVALAVKAACRADGRFEVTATAATARDALGLLEGLDAVVLDLNLPDLQGPDLVRAFRARAPHVPLVLHSADDETPQVQAVRPLVDAVAPKSRSGDLLRALRRLTGAA